MENKLTTPNSNTKRFAIVGSRLQLACYFILALFYSQVCFAQTLIRSAKSGDWNVASTWVGNQVPGAGSAVQLAEGHVVTINGQVNCASIELTPPPNNDKDYTKTELIVENGATLVTGVFTLNSKNDRRYTSLINNGAFITTGTLTIGRGSIATNASGKITVTNTIANSGDILTTTALLEIGGSYSGTGIFEKGIGTVTYTGTAAFGQTIANLGYHHLQLTGSNTKIPSAGLVVSGNLDISAGTTLKTGNYSHLVTGDIRNNGTLSTDAAQLASVTVSGDFVNTGTAAAGEATYFINGNWNNYGTLQASTSTIVLQGNTLQQIAGNNTFYNLQSNGTGGAQLLQDATILNQLTVSNSHLNTGTNTLYLGNAATLTTLETDAAHIIGKVRTSRTLTPTTPENFGNIGLSLSRNNIDPGLITVERLTGVSTEFSDGTQSITRQYNITRAGTNDISALSMTMDLGFLPKELKTKPLNEYKLYNKGQNQEATPVSSTIVDQTTIRHMNANRFGIYTLGIPVMPLPVELVWFKAERREHVVMLTWQTASEQDNQGFEIQASQDGKTFEPIGFVASKSPDSHVAQQYTYLDNKAPYKQVTFYRLKQVDFSGEVTYSAIKSVNGLTGSLTVQATPNPFKDYIRFVSDAASVQVALTNLNGKTILTQILTPQDRTIDGYYKLDTTQIEAAGIYVLTIQTPEQTFRSKLLKQ
ncbi:T9SS type A sorting domain-containing protein [Pontibacter sp. H259]|uniref:T9SS type A sorting domain-containing protein n=1 Tax=Pontibacter sp. H259 TaxID=3133421 RepID=UPI0030C4E639